MLIFHYAVHPPSTGILIPFIYDAYFEHKNNANYPKSSVVTNYKEGYFYYKINF